MFFNFKFFKLNLLLSLGLLLFVTIICFNCWSQVLFCNEYFLVFNVNCNWL